jgi:hypothetical protein
MSRFNERITIRLTAADVARLRHAAAKHQPWWNTHQGLSAAARAAIREWLLLQAPPKPAPKSAR